MASSYGRKKFSRPHFGVMNYLFRREYKNPPEIGRQFLQERLAMASNLFRRDLKGHFGCVNAIEFSHGSGEWIISGGDDRRILMWNVQKALAGPRQPIALKGEHNSNIFCLSFDHQNKKIFSGGNDEQVLIHDVETGETRDVFMHDDVVYGLSVDPNNDNVFASAGDDGRILIYDIREQPSSDPFCLANYSSSMHAVVYNPVEPRLLATANAKEGVGLWDIRKPKTCLLRYSGYGVQQNCMSVRINSLGTRLIALRRRQPLVLYDIHSARPICEFDHSGYYNSCTMKSCSFAGDTDQYVLSGSDDFNVYMWRIPDDLSRRVLVKDTHLILKGHRSIVNQVRFNAASHLIVSSGVEKVVKIWSPFPMPQSEGGLCRGSVNLHSERPLFSHEEYINLVLRSGQVMSHDYSQESMEEDPRMMAFFDSLVLREVEGCSSDDSACSVETRAAMARTFLYNDSDTSSNSDAEAAANPTAASGRFSPFSLALVNALSSSEVDRSSREPPGDTEASNAAEVNAAASDPLLEQLPAGLSAPPDFLLPSLENIGEENSETSAAATNGESSRGLSISQLIAKKRQEAKAERKSSKSRDRSRRKRSWIRSSSESNDYEIVEEGVSKTVKRSSRNNGESSNGLATSDAIDLTNQSKVQQNFKRLRQLRARLANSDSESSDIDSEVTFRIRGKLPIGDTGHSSDVNGNFSNSASEKKTKNGNTGTCHREENGNAELLIGPHLYEAVRDTNMSLPSTSYSYYNPADEANNPVSVAIPSTSSCSSSKPASSVMECNGRTNSTNENIRNSNNETRVSSIEQEQSNNQSVLTEFKRFKHRRVERARRQYRHHSSSVEQRSSEEDGS